ncbi:MAG: HAMP domain-containing protein [Acidimicrobiia bacterium]|nr:HAMP domain-containing protein [Acidimicrobiia bacterium]
MPIRVRLTAFAAVGALLAVLVGGWIFVHQLRDGLHASVDSSLRTRADALVQTVSDTRGGIDFQDQGSTKLLDAKEAIAQIIGPAGGVVEASQAAGRKILIPADVVRAAQRSTVYAEGRIPHDSHPSRFLATPVVRSDGRWVVVVGSSLEAADDAVSRVQSGLVLGGIVTVLLAAGGAWLLGTLALRPVERMRRQAASISEHDAEGRLPLSRTHDEIAELGETMNALLARLQQALAQQRAFVADAGHELRTPLAILRTELELASLPDRDEFELRHAIAEAATETERLSQLAEELLFLARHDEHGPRRSRELQPMRPILDRAAAVAISRAARKRVAIALDVDPELAAAVIGDDIRRAIDNVLTNAVRHAPIGSTVEIRAARVRDDLVITIADQGPGFPAEFLPRAFERFGRADTARTRDDGGSGLGLAIVRAVARDHGGDADVSNRPDGGAEVSIRFPIRS